MSYQKAMKHHNNVRKCKKQSNMYMGFHSGEIIQESQKGRKLTCQIQEVNRWFKSRHDGDSQHSRECIREAIERLRTLYAAW